MGLNHTKDAAVLTLTLIGVIGVFASEVPESVTAMC